MKAPALILLCLYFPGLPVRAQTRPSENYKIIKAAIKNKHNIIARYDNRARVLTPHIIGIGPRGAENALFYQFSGESNSIGGKVAPGSPVNWRCLHLHKLEILAIIPGEQHAVSEETGKPQYCVKEIHMDSGLYI